MKEICLNKSSAPSWPAVDLDRIGEIPTRELKTKALVYLGNSRAGFWPTHPDEGMVLAERMAAMNVELKRRGEEIIL